MSFVITIDGPAGSGKSTVSLKLAKRLNFPFLTTGAFYRGLALLAKKRKISFEEPKALAKLADDSGWKVVAQSSGTQVFIDKRDVTDELNTDEVSQLASKIAAFQEVRKALLQAQRSFDREPGLIAEGRDCGTVVFPKARVKIFLTASLDERANRRSQDYKAASDEQKQSLAERDKRDSSRKTAPLAKAGEAVEIDTSSLSVDEVVDKIENLVRAQWK